MSTILHFLRNNAQLSRFNYILWIQELIDSTSKDYTHHYDHEREVVGLDMYVDRSNISITLSQSIVALGRVAYTHCWAAYQGQHGSSQSPVRSSETLVTEGADPNADVDSKNMDYAKRNVLKNKLKSRIRPLEVEPSKPLIPLDDLGLQW